METTQLKLFDTFAQDQTSHKKLKAIDLFAGIGGIRLGFEQAFKDDIEFVFSSELDKFAQQTYHANHGEMPHGDITQIHAQDILPEPTPLSIRLPRLFRIFRYQESQSFISPFSQVK